jgi:hypothetical protein
MLKEGVAGNMVHWLVLEKLRTQNGAFTDQCPTSAFNGRNALKELRSGRFGMAFCPN